MKTAFVAITVLVALLAPRGVRAELYAFTDKDGVVHFTNIPDDPRFRPFPKQGAANTYAWKDELGTLRNVYRVDIGTYDRLAVEAAQYYSLPPALIKAVMAAESSFEPAAISHAGAQGLMQLIPSTARAMKVRDPFNPRDNVFGGARYLRLMANRFGGDLRKTIAAYNAGPKAVEKAGGVPPLSETQRYVPRVLRLYRHYLETMLCGSVTAAAKCDLKSYDAAKTKETE